MKCEMSLVELDVPSRTLNQTPLNSNGTTDIYPASKVLFSKVIDKETYKLWEERINLLVDVPNELIKELRDYQQEGREENLVSRYNRNI